MSSREPFSLPLSSGLADRDALASMSGLEVMQAIQDGRLPSAAISKSLQLDVVEVEEGRVVFAGKPSAEFYNPLGTVHGGWPSTLLDSCMGCAVHTTLAAPANYTTLELKVNFIRPIFAETGIVRAEGKGGACRSAYGNGRRAAGRRGRQALRARLDDLHCVVTS